MMNNSISDFGFMDVTKLWVMNIKISIFAVLIFFMDKVLMQFEKIVFYIAFKYLDINFFAFAFFEFVPSGAEVFRSNHVNK